MNKKVCCISGKRDIPPESEKTIREKLRFQIQKAINDSYTVFICGFARGTDIMAAEIIIDFKKQFGNAADIKLDAYLPYDKMQNSKKINELLKECDYITSCSPYYHRGCFHCTGQNNGRQCRYAYCSNRRRRNRWYGIYNPLCGKKQNSY